MVMEWNAEEGKSQGTMDRLSEKYEGQSIRNASYYFSFTFQENSNTIT